MKKLSLEMLRLTSDEVLQRSQMKMVKGGAGAWICRCGLNPPITVYDGDGPGYGGDPTQICQDVYGTGGSCTPANP
jgi:natural product precursor